MHMYEIGVDGYSHVKTVEAVSSLYESFLPSSYGLVCLHGCFNRKFVVFNPNTEQIRSLQDYPESFGSFELSWPLDGPEIFYHPYFNNLGFGFDLKSRRYKVVQLVRDSETHGTSKCYALTVERFESQWREINDASLDCKVGDLLFPVCVDGVIYWETKSMIPDKIIHILTFDLRCEKIKIILAPEECMDNGFDFCRRRRHLVELQGKLCFADVKCTTDELVHMDIWMLKYSGDRHISWAPMYKLELGAWCTCSAIFPVTPLCINGMRIILLGNGEMYCYDIKEKSLETYKWDGEDSARHHPWLFHTETIVSLD